ncbi:MAG: response regulator transcription factor [Chloroflexi bacterium]|nr:response regulator transcription factor [Chloroflexota bacterium]
MGTKRLLLIEDDADVAEMLLAYFSSQSYEILHADTGQEGIALARSRFPNLVLLDVMLPDMVGFEVCRSLRTTNLTKFIPIIFLTQRDARADKVAGLEIGADDYITKPFDIEELRLRVQGSIRRATRDHLHEPRTGLPTGPLIAEEYEQQRDKDGWHYLDITIIGFETFRDQYGFLAADAALSLAAQVLTQTVASLGTSDDFVGTTTEGNFIIFTHTSAIDEMSQTLHETFRTRVESLYNFADVQQGYLIANEDTEERLEVPLMHFETAVYEPDNIL